MSAGSLGQAKGEIVLDPKPALEGIKSVQAGLQGMSDQSDKNTSGLKANWKEVGTTLGGIGAAAAAGIGVAVKGFVDFDAQMANVNSIAKLSKGELDSMGQSLLDMASRTGQAPKVLAAGLYD